MDKKCSKCGGVLVEGVMLDAAREASERIMEYYDGVYSVEYKEDKSPLTSADVTSNDTIAAMLKNAFLIGTHYLFATILVFAVHFVMFFVVVAWFTPLILFGEGLCALISAWLLNSLLISVSGMPDDSSEEPRP